MNKLLILLAGLTAMSFCLRAQISPNHAANQQNSGIIPAGNPNHSPTSGTWRCGQPITDPRDGQVYQTVSIVNNCWMKQNLNYGTQIAAFADPSNNGIVEKYCYEDLPGNCNIFGGLYRFGEAVQYSYGNAPQGACPPGWHVPTDGEFMQLHMYLNVPYYFFGGMLKATGSWNMPNTGATNSTGFSALAAGYCKDLGTAFAFYYHLGNFSYYWESHNANAKGRSLAFDDNCFCYTSTSDPVGYSVRCVYDLPTNNQQIRNIDVPSDIRCYQALDTIRTAGDSSYFTMYQTTTANVSMIAGSTIQLLPGTVVQHGTTLYAQITTTGQYCSLPVTPPAMPAMGVEGTDAPGDNGTVSPFLVYPNPTAGLVTVETCSRPDAGPVQVSCYDMTGNLVLESVFKTGNKVVFSLEERNPGIYLLRIRQGESQEKVRLIKL